MMNSANSLTDRAARRTGYGNSRGLADGPVARGIATVVLASALLLLVRPGMAGDTYPVPGYFAESLTAQSTWRDILKAPGIEPDFPMLDFGTMYVTLAGTCVDGRSVRIADPRSDNGVRLAITDLPGQPLTVASREEDSGEAVGAIGIRPVAASAAEAGQPGVTSSPRVDYVVHVYRVLSGNINVIRVFLFDKSWEMPGCPTQPPTG